MMSPESPLTLSTFGGFCRHSLEQFSYPLSKFITLEWRPFCGPNLIHPEAWRGRVFFPFRVPIIKQIDVPGRPVDLEHATILADQLTVPIPVMTHTFVSEALRSLRNAYLAVAP